MLKTRDISKLVSPFEDVSMFVFISKRSLFKNSLTELTADLWISWLLGYRGWVLFWAAWLRQDVVLKMAAFFTMKEPRAGMWLITMFILAFGQRWTCMAPQNELHQASQVTQTILHLDARSFPLGYNSDTCGSFLALWRSCKISWHTFTFPTFSLSCFSFSSTWWMYLSFISI